MKKLFSTLLALALFCSLLTIGAACADYEYPGETLVDNAYCSVTVKSIDPDNMWGYTLKLLLENKSDKELMFSIV